MDRISTPTPSPPNACATRIEGVRDRGWSHHIQRLMVLGNHALQRGYRPDELTEWFATAYVDGFRWVMPTNVVGMSQHADGGLLATKPYASGGAYINKMSDHCGDCAYDPKKRLGDDACPFTAGYWNFVHRNRDMLAKNNRTQRVVSTWTGSRTSTPCSSRKPTARSSDRPPTIESWPTTSRSPTFPSPTTPGWRPGTATTRCPTAGSERPVCCCPRSRWASGTTSATTGRSTCIGEVLRHAFDRGITHFDLANNYGPPYGSAEENFGRMLRRDFKPYRNELIISTKAGWDMWPGPYGQLGGRAYLLASLDESLDRIGLDYVDVFYSHRIDPVTPLEETIGALDTAVRAGKARYVGISSYSAAKTAEAAAIAQRLGTPLVIHQPSYSLLNRWIEGGLTDRARPTPAWARSRSPRSARAC